MHLHQQLKEAMPRGDGDGGIARMKWQSKQRRSVPVEKKIGETTVTFDVSVPCSVPSDGKLQTVEIQRLTAPAEYKYVTTPKLSQLPTLRQISRDWAKLNLQSGEATLYFENSFVGKSNVNVRQLTDTLHIVARDR